MRIELRQYQWSMLAGTLILWGMLAGASRAAEVTESGRITYEVASGVYINVGTDQGLREGTSGSLTLDDGRAFNFEVLHAARQSALLRLVNPPEGESFVGLNVELAFEGASPDEGEAVAEEQDRPSDPNESAKTEAQEEFVPLLAPTKRLPEITRPENVSHGRIQIRQILQTDSETDLDYSMTRLGSSGSVERIGGSPWSFEWSGNVRYRDGDAYIRHPEYQEAHLDLYEAVLQHPFDEGGFLRLGRFLPHELPGIGYVDGVQSEIAQSEHVRLGAIAGLKPGRRDLDASTDEPLFAGYTTLEAGTRERGYYSGTIGVMGSLYDGETDRLALLVDQRAGFGSDLTLYSTAAIDFDVGAAQARNGTRLTRLDLYGVSKLTSSVTLRGGVDHWERPDNLAERELLVVDDDRFFDDGHWRYWIGSGQRLTKSLRISEEVAFIDSDNGEDGARWRVGVTQAGLFSRPDASVTVTVYNLLGDAVDGYGGRVSGYLPLLDRKLFVQPSAGFRMLQTDPEDDDFTLSYLSLRLDGRISKHWTLLGGATYSFGDEVDTSLFEIGLRYAW